MVFSRRHVFIAALAATVTGLFAGACGQTNPCFSLVCDTPSVCNPQSGRCELPAGFDGGTRRDAGVDCTPECAAGEVCNRSTGRCVQCLVNGDCRCPNPVCVEGQCTPDTTTVQVVDAGDTCANAPSFIACGPKTFTVDTNLTTASPSVQASCAVRDAGAGDVMFNVVLGTPSDLRVSVAANGGGAQPVIAVRQQCATDVDLTCRSSQGINTTYRVRRLPEGAYTVVIQGYDRAGSGPALATVAVEAPSGSSNETCLLAERLPLDGGTVRPELVGADDDAALSCNLGGGPELFYRFTLSELSDVTVTANGTDPLRPALALYSSCDAASSLACATSSTANGRLVARRLGAGEYFLAVENQGQATMGRVELSATTEPSRPPPSNDTCAIPADLIFSGNEATVLADSSRGTDDITATCGGGGSPDLVYRFNVPALATYTITATPQAGSGGAPVLSLRRGQCGATVDGGTSEVACQPPTRPGEPVTLTVQLNPDTYYLWVDSTTASTAGAVTITVRR